MWTGGGGLGGNILRRGCWSSFRRGLEKGGRFWGS